VLTSLLRYRAVIRPNPQRLAPLMAGLTVGAVLAGILITLAEPPRTPPAAFTADPTQVNAAPTQDVPTPSLSISEKATPTSTTTRKTAPPVAPAAAAGPAAAVLASTNSQRAAAGCPPVRGDAQLARAAQGHAADMAAKGYFSHTSRDGRTFSQRVLAAGYPRPGGENIAQGQSSAAEVLQAWMTSSGHRANILNCSFTALGVGYDSNGDYWVQNFGR